MSQAGAADHASATAVSQTTQRPNDPAVEEVSMEDAGGELSLEDYFQRFVLQHQDAMNETELAQNSASAVSVCGSGDSGLASRAEAKVCLSISLLVRICNTVVQLRNTLRS